MRVLVSAYACGPGQGSEPGVGWQWVSGLARQHDVWVLTRPENRPAIARALTETPLPRARWFYADVAGLFRVWRHRKCWAYSHYFLWQLAAYSAARRLIRRERFDVVHHVTYVNYWMPSFLALLPVPFVWGPVGGGERVPPALRPALSARHRVVEFCRGAARRFNEANGLAALTAKRARCGFATSGETRERMIALGCRRVEVMSQVGLTAAERERLAEIAVRRRAGFRVLSIGRLLYWKGFHLGLHAFRRLLAAVPEAEYWLVGAGPERGRLERLAGRLGIGAATRFLGGLSRESVIDALTECDVLLHPSLHDSGGLVCAEAMAAGRPVVCIDTGGPALIVGDASGFRVPAAGPVAVVDGLAAALGRLAAGDGLLSRMAAAARAECRERLAWELKLARAAAAYAEAAGTGKAAGGA